MNSKTDKPRYAVIIEQAGGGYSAYVPDLLGTAATADTLDEVKKLIGEVVEQHLAGMREHGHPIPEPTTLVDYVVVERPKS